MEIMITNRLDKAEGRISRILKIRLKNYYIKIVIKNYHTHNNQDLLNTIRTKTYETVV
jgi:hypothetical protein